jgi:hypothetical protein
MRTVMLCLSSVLGLMLSLDPCRGDQDARRRAMQAVDAYLQQIGATNYHITPARGPYIPNTFPNDLFFGVYFDQWPLAVTPPPGLAPSNVFYVDRSSLEVNYLTDPDELQQFFEDYFSQIVDATGGSNLVADAAKTWLRLSQEFSQDGFFQFSKPQVEASGRTAYGYVTVVSGGEGYIAVTITFMPTGGVSIQEDRHVIRGERPI